MKNLIFCCALLCSTTVFADDAGVVSDAGVISDAGVAVVAMPALEVVGDAMDAGVSDAGVVVAVPSLDEPLTSMKGFYKAVKTGNGWLAAMFMLFFLVGFIRIVGKRVHAMIPDDTKNKFLVPVEKILYFIFDTKIGGWVLNWLSAVGGCLSTAAMAGVPVDGAAWKVAVMASTGGTALIELKDDVMEWWDKKNAEKAAEAAAKAAVVAPPAAVTPPEEPPKA